MRQRAFASPANVLSPTAQTELCSDRVSDPGGAGYGAKRNGRAERLQGVRRQAELQRDREEARHGPAHGRQVLEGGRGRRRREVREGQRLRPARGGDPREGPAARDDQDGRLRVPARGPRGGAARVRRLHRVVPGARRALWGRGRPRAAPAVRDAPGQAAAVRLEGGHEARRLGGRGLRVQRVHRDARLLPEAPLHTGQEPHARRPAVLPARHLHPPRRRPGGMHHGQHSSAASRRNASRTTCRAW